MADITIKKCNDFLVWKQAIPKLEKNMRVAVDDGLVALAMVGGRRAGVFTATNNGLFNEKGALSQIFGKKSNACFLVFNKKKTVVIRWGIGKDPVTYADKRMRGMQLNVTAYGHCKVRVSDAEKLCIRMESTYVRNGVIEPSEVESAIQRELTAEVSSLLADALGKVGEYTKMRASASAIGDEISAGLLKIEGSGLHVTDTIIEGMRYTDESMEKIRKNERLIAAQIDGDLVKEQASQIRDIIAAVSGKEEV